MNSTKWYRSKAVWLGVMTMGMAGLQASQDGATWQSIAIAVVGAGIVAVRAMTNGPLSK